MRMRSSTSGIRRDENRGVTLSSSDLHSCISSSSIRSSCLRVSSSIIIIRSATALDLRRPTLLPSLLSSDMAPVLCFVTTGDSTNANASEGRFGDPDFSGFLLFDHYCYESYVCAGFGIVEVLTSRATTRCSKGPRLKTHPHDLGISAHSTLLLLSFATSSGQPVHVFFLHLLGSVLL